MWESGGVAPATPTPGSHDVPRAHPRESPPMLRWPLGWDPAPGLTHCTLLPSWTAARDPGKQQRSCGASGARGLPTSPALSTRVSSCAHPLWGRLGLRLDVDKAMHRAQDTDLAPLWPFGVREMWARVQKPNILYLPPSL